MRHRHEQSAFDAQSNIGDVVGGGMARRHRLRERGALQSDRRRHLLRHPNAEESLFNGVFQPNEADP